MPQAYSTPPFFRDDWLNDYYDMRSGRSRFVCMAIKPYRCKRAAWGFAEFKWVCA